jgi:hypothetical protein
MGVYSSSQPTREFSMCRLPGNDIVSRPSPDQKDYSSWPNICLFCDSAGDQELIDPDNGRAAEYLKCSEIGTFIPRPFFGLWAMFHASSASSNQAAISWSIENVCAWKRDADQGNAKTSEDRSGARQHFARCAALTGALNFMSS